MATGAARVQELKAVHDRKVKALMGSIAALKAQVATLTEASKTHAVAKSVQRTQKALREQELVSDVLKGMLESAAGLSRDEVRRDLNLRARALAPRAPHCARFDHHHCCSRVWRTWGAVAGVVLVVAWPVCPPS